MCLKSLPLCPRCISSNSKNRKSDARTRMKKLCLDMICSCPLYIMQCDNSTAEEIGIFKGKHISLTWGPEHSLPAERVPQAKEPLFCHWPLPSLQEWQYILHQPVIHLKVLHRSCSAWLCQKNKIERGWLVCSLSPVAPAGGATGSRNAPNSVIINIWREPCFLTKFSWSWS